MDLDFQFTLNLRTDEVAAKVKDALWKAAVRTAVDIENDAHKAVPVRTGRLKDSIKVDVTKVEGLAAIEARAEAPYAAFVELGTAKTRAQPFLGPAVRNNVDKLLQRVAEELK